MIVTQGDDVDDAQRWGDVLFVYLCQMRHLQSLLQSATPPLYYSIHITHNNPTQSTFQPIPPHSHPPSPGEYLSVRVVLAAATDIRDACMLALRCFTPPRVAPNREILEAPIWTTWARYHSRVSQPKVLQYAQEIVDRNLQRSVMEIDDRCVLFWGGDGCGGDDGGGTIVVHCTHTMVYTKRCSQKGVHKGLYTKGLGLYTICFRGGVLCVFKHFLDGFCVFSNIFWVVFLCILKQPPLLQ